MKKFTILISVLVGLSVFCLPSIGACHATGFSCPELTSLKLPDAKIISATDIPATPPTPEYCLLEGVIGGTIKIEVKLPVVAAWNGNFLMMGNGGFAGNFQHLFLSEGPQPLVRGYATVETDTGHVGAFTDGSWALNDRPAQINFGFLAVHRSAVITKDIIKAYYGTGPRVSYFIGCSRGGGQAMIESQKYPDDFNGIIAGAPAYSWTGFNMGFVWDQQLMWPNWPANTTGTLPNSKLGMLSSAVLAKCADKINGVPDNIITDPRKCDFNPYTDLTKCSDGDQPNCFTLTQIAAIKRVYDGPSNHKGRVWFGFPVSGVESNTLGWVEWVTYGQPLFPGSNFPNAQYAFGRDFMRYFVYSDPSYQIDNFNFETDVKDIAKAEAILDGYDTNLTPFKDRGGKMIMFAGWADYAITPLGTISYYEKVLEKMGKKSDVDDFFRLFLAPGMCHCMGGPGPNTADWMTALEQWVEKGIAPGSIIADGLNPADGKTRTRPLCPYPKVAKYLGSGDPDVAANFVCAEPSD